MLESGLRGGRFRACLTGSVWLHLMAPAHTEVYTVPVVISVKYHSLDGLRMPLVQGTPPRSVRWAEGQRR